MQRLANYTIKNIWKEVSAGWALFEKIISDHNFEMLNENVNSQNTQQVQL